LPVDRLLLNEDPGAWKRDDGVWCNCNRQIVSTLKGLEAGTRTYAMKVRTDTALSGRRILDVDLEGEPRPGSWRVFARRIVVLEKYTRDPAKSSLLHFVSDLFQYGLREDLIRLWDVPPASEAGYVGWSRTARALFLAPFPGHRTFMRYADEQYVWISCLARSGIDVPLDYFSQCRRGDISAAEGLMTANFTVVSEKDADVELPARFQGWAYPESCFTSADWARLVRIYAADGSESLRARRRRHVWLASRARLARLAAARLWPPYLLRSTLHSSHALRERYRRIKGRLKGPGPHL
jgi:WavE lipopolysaccharide synthesis protein